MRPKAVDKRNMVLTVIRAYGYFSTSKSLYRKLRKDYKLPSVKTLTNLISKVNNTSDRKFLMEAFSGKLRMIEVNYRTRDNDVGRHFVLWP